MKAVRLRTIGLKDPIGIDETKPVFSWNCEDGVTQSAYRVVAIDADGKTAWDSGKVQSASMSAVYEGRQLCSRDIITYSVTCFDENGN